jgi:hypothetical protein
MRRSEKIASVIAGISLSSAGLLGVYTLSGPVLAAPIVVTIPDAVMGVLCNADTVGCYLPALPDFILLTPKGAAHPATLPHELLHYAHTEWSECEVSNYLFETTGLRDGYQKNGEC